MWKLCDVCDVNREQGQKSPMFLCNYNLNLTTHIDEFLKAN